MSDELDIKQTVARWGEKLLTVSGVVDRVNGTSGHIGLAEEVAELRAGHRAAERERDQIVDKIDKLGESLRTEMRALSSHVQAVGARSWPERWATTVGWLAIIVAIGVALFDYLKHASGVS